VLIWIIVLLKGWQPARSLDFLPTGATDFDLAKPNPDTRLVSSGRKGPPAALGEDADVRGEHD
jgi:hypothetical protein